VVGPFSAIVTTGIYCRPGCPAQPLPENRRLYGLAAAAEAAGYRACHRCRPYRSAPTLTWTSPELVCRAVQMILDGALDKGTEPELAARLGVSARHLRRYFAAHLGVSPDGLARSHRAHFARRLLDDTEMTVLEIAFASGFGSLRQFNRICKDVFRASPRELRAKRRLKDRLAADGGLLLRLPFHGPLDWDAMLTYFSRRAIPGVERIADGVYRRTIVVRGDPGVLELYRGGSDHLLMLAHLPHWRELIHVVERARRIASLDLDLSEPTDHLSDDPTIGPLLAARPGIRVPGTWDPFETGVRAIIGRQATEAGANTISSRLVARLGTPVPGLAQFGLTHAFPSVETLVTADLSNLGLTKRQSAAIRSFARATAEDRVRLDRSVSLDSLVSSLTALEGVGTWTADYLALRLGERDAYPTTDRGLRRALESPALPPGAHAEIAEPWRPWRALAATHLWLADPSEPARAA